MEEVFVFGIGNYSEPIIELIHDCGYEIAGLYHYNNSKRGTFVMDYEILGDYQDFFDQYKTGKVVVAVGDNGIREEKLDLLKNKGYEIINLIHPNAFISPSAKIGSGVYLHADSFVWTKCRIGDYSILSPKAILSHHVTIGKACLVSTKSMVGAYVLLKDRVLVGNNAGIIAKKIEIGSDTIIGANSFVTKSFSHNSVLVGSPARFIKSNA
ncbi:NeuD/PglB/VioB family sugar acetyltransferase [Wenyingzhuangia sp. IMCC45533]